MVELPRKKKDVEIIQALCTEDFFGKGRLSPSSKELCFKTGVDYFFIVDSKREQVFTLDETRNVHSFKMYDQITQQHFDFVRRDLLTNFDMDDIQRHKLQRLHKEKYDYIDD